MVDKPKDSMSLLTVLSLCPFRYHITKMGRVCSYDLVGKSVCEYYLGLFIVNIVSI